LPSIVAPTAQKIKLADFTNYEKQRLQKEFPRENSGVGRQVKISEALDKKGKSPFLRTTLSTE
jgi:hypothetical protein